MAPKKTIKSFGDLSGSDSEDDNDEFNDYYAGGEKSGQMIRGAPSDKKDKDKVSTLFDKARKAGAVDGSAADLEPAGGQASGGGGGGAFRGAGRSLAGGETAGGSGGARAGQGPSNHVITFYKNGIFTVDDGPPRMVNDPANLRFIDSISKGECPEELDSQQPVTVNLVKKEEDYKEPEKPKYSAFQGSGRTLNSAEGGGGPSNAGANGIAAAVAALAAATTEWEGVDDSKPTTSLQIRLADGSRMVAKFNHSHTISDIRRFIRASRPEMTVRRDQALP